MASGTIVGTFVKDGFTHLAVRVPETENGKVVQVEYIGRVPIDDAWDAMTNPQKKAALVAAVKAVRDSQITAPAAAPSLTGAVTL